MVEQQDLLGQPASHMATAAAAASTGGASATAASTGSTSAAASAIERRKATEWREASIGRAAAIELPTAFYRWAALG